MEIKGAIRVITAVVACLLLHVSCVNADYEVSEDRLNLEVTIFQDGISLPLGKIEGVYLKDYKEFMIRELGDTSFVKYLTVGENGEWGAGVSDTLDISDTLNNLLANIDIPDIPFSETFTFNLNTVDVSSLKVPAAEYS